MDDNAEAEVLAANRSQGCIQNKSWDINALNNQSSSEAGLSAQRTKHDSEINLLASIT